jgi:hypothetical protein
LEHADLDLDHVEPTGVFRGVSSASRWWRPVIDNLGPALQMQPAESSLTELVGRMRNDCHHIGERIKRSATTV